MSKLSKNKICVIYFVLTLVILWLLSYICFAFVMAELNPFKWGQDIRSGYVFSMVIIFVISLLASQLIDLKLN